MDRKVENYYHQFTCLLARLMQKPHCLEEPSSIEIITYPLSFKTAPFIHELFDEEQRIKDWSPFVPVIDSCENSLFSTWNQKFSPDQELIATTEEEKLFFLWRKFVFDKFNLTNPVKKPTQEGGILIIDRKKRRSIVDSKKLVDHLEKALGKKTAVVYFESMSFREQVTLMKNSHPSYIITPHGANLLNLIYLGLPTAHTTKIIELCPPYTHCICNESYPDYFRICPYYYYEKIYPFLRLNYYGYAQEKEGQDCAAFCEENNKENFSRSTIRDIDFIEVDAPFLAGMMATIEDQDEQGMSYAIHEHLFIEKNSANRMHLSE